MVSPRHHPFQPVRGQPGQSLRGGRPLLRHLDLRHHQEQPLSDVMAMTLPAESGTYLRGRLSDAQNAVAS